MTRLETLTGLKAEGPHRQYAEYLFAQYPICRVCAGQGVVGGRPGPFFACPTCDGTGRPYGAGSPAMTALRNQVLAFYPDALHRPAPAPAPAISPAPRVVADVRRPATVAIAAPLFGSVTTPQSPHPIRRILSPIVRALRKVFEFGYVAMCVFHVVVFGWMVAILLLGAHEFVWAVVLWPVGCVFTWLLIAHAQDVARHWRTLTDRTATAGAGAEEEDEGTSYRRRAA